MNFQRAQEQFQQIETLRKNGKIDLVSYHAALESLRVIDDRGVTWQMQEVSGDWYYFWEGQWAPGTPPQSTPQADSGRVPIQKQRKSIPLIIGLTLAVGAVGIFILLAILGAYFLFKPPGVVANTDNPPTLADQGALSQPPVDFLTLEKLSDALVTADGLSVTDANGVSIQIPPEALISESGSGKAVVTTFKMQGRLADVLSKDFSLDSPIYTVEAEGQQDSTGRAALVFPAPSPESRLVQIIDDRYLMLVNSLPVDGKLSFHARMGPADTQELSPTDSLRYDGSMRFMVITPKKTSQPEFAPVSFQLQKTPGVICTTANMSEINPCHANEEQTVKVSWDYGLNFSSAEAYQVAKAAEKWAEAYANKGFSNANLSWYWFAMQIVIEAGAGDPQYNPKNGVIYMPLDFARKIGSGDGSTALMHAI